MANALRRALPDWGRLGLYLALPYLPVLLLAWKNTLDVPELPTPSPSSTPAPDPGVSVALPGGAHPSPGPARWELKALESPPWKLLMTDHLAIRSDVSSRSLRDLGSRAEAVFDEIQSRLGGTADGIRFSIRAFSNPREFALLAAHAGVPDAASYYDSRQAEAVLQWSPDLAAGAAEQRLRHELSHLYMDRVFDRREPPWLCEGVATWIEGGGHEDGTGRVPLGQLLRADGEQFYDPSRIKDYYAASASLLRLLVERPGQLNRLLHGEALERIEDMRDLESRWRGAVTASK